jgi:hypothetical protein
MIKEFKENVEKLFHTTITKRGSRQNTASELLHLLECKVTLPVKSIWEDDCLRLIYCNVSLDIKNDLSSMTVSYNSDYTIHMEQLEHCDMYQMADYILALEQDIPKWRHLWMADEKLRKEKAKIEERRKKAMRDIRNAWTTHKGCITEEMERDHRIHYYNIKALDLMLKNDNPFWENKKTEAEILDQCHIYHIEPPMEQWFEEWTAFAQDCQREKNERERLLEEYYNNIMKRQHLINIKLLKINALIKTIELHPSITVSASKHIDGTRMKRGTFHITVNIDDASVTLRVRYDLIDGCMGKIIESIKKVNDLMPELHRSLSKESEKQQLCVRSKRYGCFMMNGPLEVALKTQPYYMDSTIQNTDSSKVVDRINAIFNELWNDLG